jgi:hypothetical protein
MGHFTIKRIKKYIKNIPVAVETGTFMGDGTRVMSQNFEKVHTIELDKTLHAETSKTLLQENYINVVCHLGDSGAIVEELSKKLDRSTMFFLDAHWSGDTSVNWGESDWKGYDKNTAHLGDGTLPTSEEQVPLDREIKAVAKLFKSRGLVYIDDLDKFSFSGKGLKDKAFSGEDYSHLDMKAFRQDFGYRMEVWKNLKGKQLIIKFGKIPENYFQGFTQKLYYYTCYKPQFFGDNLKRYFRRYVKNK